MYVLIFSLCVLSTDDCTLRPVSMHATVVECEKASVAKIDEAPVDADRLYHYVCGAVMPPQEESPWHAVSIASTTRS